MLPFICGMYENYFALLISGKKPYILTLIHYFWLYYSLNIQNFTVVSEHFDVLTGQDLCCTGSLTVYSKKLAGALEFL